VDVDISRRVLITGGAGFIGSNLANRLLKEGKEVVILDNLGRSGCEHNLTWLQQEHGSGSFHLVKGSITDFDMVRKAMDGVDVIYHLAGQVAVTTSVHNPRQDFEYNCLGTFNVLEAARLHGCDPIVLYASTNKVYGRLDNIQIEEGKTRYEFQSLKNGIHESQPLDFHSPYGCSKGAGDQYVRDYARIYGLRTVVMRQSCIYGYRQFGIEDQGWLAWFIIAALKNLPITIYGNGKQVRDALFIEDLLDAYEAAISNISASAGQVYNIGGGPANTISIWTEFGSYLEQLMEKTIPVHYASWRPGDQPVYVSDIRKAQHELGWEPRVPVRQGIQYLLEWICGNMNLYEHLESSKDSVALQS
jgi:CDP-paratose 2-epimerase